MSSDKPADHRACVGPHAAAAAGGDQLPLLPGETEADGDARLPIANSKAATPGRGGRPDGARNRRTDLVAQYVIGRYGDPLEGHVVIGMMPLVDLVKTLRMAASDAGIKLDMSIKDVVALQRECRKDALPYLHAKRAPEDQKGDVKLPVIAVGTYAAPGSTVVQGVSIEDRLAAAKTIENTGEFQRPPKKSDDEKSDDDAND